MERYCASSYAIYRLQFHLLWMTRNREPILLEPIKKRVRHYIREVCATHSVTILEGSVKANHVYLIVSMPTQLPLSRFMQYVKGKTSKKVMDEFTELKQSRKSNHLWERGYLAFTVGGTSEVELEDYIVYNREEFLSKHGVGSAQCGQASGNQAGLR